MTRINYEDRAIEALQDGYPEAAQVYATLAICEAQREANYIALIALHGKDSIVGDAIYQDEIVGDYALEDYERVSREREGQ